MIYLLARYLEGLGEPYGFFRVLGYISVRSIAAAITTLLLVLLFAPGIIRRLYLAGQRDTHRDFDINLAKSKRGTPTMGGLLILGAVFISLLLWGNPLNPYLWLLASAMVVFGLLGAADDLAKVRGGGAEAGLSRRAKLLIQTAYGLAVGVILLLPASTPFPHAIADTIGVPFLKPEAFGGADVHLGWAYVLFVAFVIVAVSNAVNLIDGLDGLAAGTTLFTALVYGVLAYILGNVKLSGYFLYPFLPGVHELVVFVAALFGALVGFLWFNSYPAEVFMGDTGSLSLGGILAVMVVLTKQELLFLVAGGLFLYVNATHLIGDRIGIHWLGRRLFYRTPIHHSYEHLGIAETKVVMRFWIVSLILALLALATLKLR
ncbi:MAG TPA: phospho-N-acetylmuramoyl-pentapeptide-transferase [Bacteroidetes bacterium]|nr:phospho-N-acetylmuramoyl-pentapeptide-transferase [Bacteroidota bacterium]